MATELAGKGATIGPDEGPEDATVSFANGARRSFGRWALKRSASCLSGGQMNDIFDTIRIHGTYHTRGFLGNQLWDLLTSDVELAPGQGGCISVDTLVCHFGMSESDACAWLASLGVREVGPERFSDMLLHIRSKDAVDLFSILGPETMRKERWKEYAQSSLDASTA